MYLKTPVIKLIYITLIIMAVASCKNGSRQQSTTTTQDSIAIESEGIKSLSEQIEKDPENGELYYRRSVMYFEEKYLDRSLADIEDAVKIDAMNPLFQFYKGRVLYAMNRTQEAAKAYESALAIKPDYQEAAMKLAELYYVVKEHIKSMNQLNVVLAAEPGNPDALFFKGMNQKEIKDTMKAIASFQKALENDKDYYDAAMQLGLLFAAKKDPIAVEYFSTAIRLNPRSVEAYFGRAYYYQLTRQYQKALYDYRKVIDLDPSNDKAYYNVGCINFDAKQYDEALRSWNICIQMNNQNVEAYYMRGLLHEARKNYKDALMNYEYALELDQGYVLAKEGKERMSRK
jgi:tetratricopeptide (TPR) repeat protein